MGAHAVPGRRSRQSELQQGRLSAVRIANSPPSIQSTWPVTKDDPSEPRNTTALAMPWERPNRGIPGAKRPIRAGSKHGRSWKPRLLAGCSSDHTKDVEILDVSIVVQLGPIANN